MREEWGREEGKPRKEPVGGRLHEERKRTARELGGVTADGCGDKATSSEKRALKRTICRHRRRMREGGNRGRPEARRQDGDQRNSKKWGGGGGGGTNPEEGKGARGQEAIVVVVTLGISERIGKGKEETSAKGSAVSARGPKESWWIEANPKFGVSGKVAKKRERETVG